MATFVLVHGSWHDGSAWGAVVEHLESKGHRAFGPTIAGHGKGVDKDVSHAQCSQSIVDFIVEKELTDIVLVGHSFGGTIISRAVQQIPERVRRLVFLNAFVVNDGESLDECTPPQYRGAFTQLAAQSADNTVTLPFELWHAAFINDADVETARRTYALLSPEPYRPVTEKLDLKKFYQLIRSGEIPCSYLLCTDDIAMPPGEWSWHPRMSSRLGEFRLVEMPGSHEVIFTNPIALAEKIIEAGQD